MIKTAPNLPDWKPYNAKTPLSNGLRCGFLTNDANLSILADKMWGEAKNF
jgi:predicted NBD/HSP70 family sugar kinase